jgi:hypothetical protein
MALNLNFPFREIIGNQEYFDFDTISCVSLSGRTFEGVLLEVGNSSYLKIIRNGIQYECRYYSVNPLRMVLFEKFQPIKKYEYESVTTREEYKFLSNINKQKLEKLNNGN